MSPVGHWLSLEQPPQTFGLEKPQVGKPAMPEQSAGTVQLPGTQEPATQT